MEKKFSDYIVFTEEYRLDVYVCVCGYAVQKFEKMAEAFRHKIDPRLYLEKKFETCSLFAVQEPVLSSRN